MRTVLTLSLVALLAANADDKKPAAGFDAEKLVGKWTCTDGKTKGNPVSEPSKTMPYEVTKDKFHIKGPDGKDMFVIDYTLDTKATPVAIDMKITTAPVDSEKGKTAKGIIEMDGDSFKLCYDPEGKERPTKFEGDKYHWYVFKRAKEEKKPEEKKP